MGIITLTTDFGLADGYVGAMKGVILRIAPSTTVVDISHNISPQDIREAAYVIYAAYRYFPPRTVHVVVVDPGVGGKRRAIALSAGGFYFVSPDNGVLSYVLAKEKVEEIVELTNPRFHLPDVSKTFHGRDIFAPVAAHLALGAPLGALGEPLEEFITFPLPKPKTLQGGKILAHVIHVDRFGNLITDVESKEIRGKSDEAVIEIAGRRIEGIKRTFSEVEPGEPVAYIGSTGHLEIAIRDRNASSEFGTEAGEEFVIIMDRS